METIRKLPLPAPSPVKFKGEIVYALPFRHLKSRMSAHHKQHLSRIRIGDLPHDLDGPAFQPVSNLHLKMERILLICLRRVLQTKPAFVHIAEKGFKIHIPCKAVGRHAVFFPIMDIRPLITFSHKRKKHRCVSVPHRRFSAPKHFAVRLLVINPGKFCTVAGNSN